MQKVHIILLISLSLVLVALLISPVMSVTLSDSLCQADCTKADGVCHAECDGVNGCLYPNSTILTDDLRTVKEVCNLQKAGWSKYFNATYDVTCCDNKPHPVLNATKLYVTNDPDIEDIVTYSRNVNFNGKMVTMHITIWK